MNRIRLLPENVANQIAAGEVVERPASVVKELVENALDAKATRITVEIQAGGRSLIRVADDGVGMSRDDALLSIERHATSKIERAEDLYAIQTFGFRGEALPSIASVSRFVLTTCERSSAEGSPVEATQLVVQGGKILAVKAAGAPPGTTVEVRQLFFNIPARRKFLRSDDTEAAHVQHYLTLAALACPEVAFTFIKDGRTVWQLPQVRAASPLAALKERLRAIYGGELALLPVDATASLPPSATHPAAGDGEIVENEDESRTVEARLWGLIGAPGVSRGTREEQHVFVNRRPVENRGINAALLEGYHTALMKGRYPVCCLFLDVPPASVDVNIHPAKREVKFHNERAVRNFVTQAVRQTLLRFHNPDAAVERQTGGETQTAAAPPSPPPRQMPLAAPAQPPLVVAATPLFGRQPSVEKPPAAASTKEAQIAGSQAAPTKPLAASSPVDSAGSTGGGAAEQAESAESAASSGEPVPLLRVPLRFVGVIGRLYVVLESDRGLVLMDQHAAHERVLFEQMLGRLEQQGQAPTQKLLLPETVELAPRDAQFVRRNLAVLNRLGVGLSEFGERTFMLDSLPPCVKTENPRVFVTQLIDELEAAGTEVNSQRLSEQVVAKTVCRHAVKAHDLLDEIEIARLIEDLKNCAMPYTCPHGRPTILEINFRELEKKFGRIQ